MEVGIELIKIKAAVLNMLAEFKQLLIRQKTPIIFNDLTKIKPISDQFGFERGTPVDRYYIDQFLKGNCNYVSGSVLEISESHYTKMYGGKNVTRCEVLHVDDSNKNATIIGDLTKIETLPKEQVDCFICTQTFNFIFDIQKAIEGTHYVLKPGGVLLATVAGISQVSRYDMDRWGDYWRFTSASLKRLFEPVFSGGVQITTFGNVLAAIAFLQGIAVEDLPSPTLLDRNDRDYSLILGIVAQKGANR
jgi:SAM-dependent methyltransferase